MAVRLLVIFFMLTQTPGAYAQIRGCVIGNPYMYDTVRRRGSAANAITTRHHIVAATARPRVQFGYIDTTVATLDEVVNNSWVGMKVIAEGEYKIIGYEFWFLPRGKDYQQVGEFNSASFDGQGRISRSANRVFNTCAPGDQLHFEKIRVRRVSDSTVFAAQNFSILITQ